MKFPTTFPRFLWFWAKINRNPWRKPSELRNLQERMFKSVLKHAYENTVFYHRLYKSYGVKPDDIASLDDIKKLPIISKADLRKCSLEERFSQRFDKKKCREGRTSGSTGEPFSVYSEPRAVDYLRALHLRRLLIYGYKPWQTMVIIGPFWATSVPTLKRRGVRPSFLNLTDFDANGLSVSDNPYENVSYLLAIRPHVIWSPPSYLRILAQAIQKADIGGVEPRIIICGAEMLDHSTRSLLESTFRVRVFDEYGTVDVASRAIAWQCQRHEGYHINMDAVHLEFIRDGEQVSPGEEGEIVATNLFRYATPMIRYRIGDVGIPSDEPCPCGRSFPLIESIRGRSDDFLVLPNGGLISPFSVMIELENVPGVSKYQVVQEETDRVVVSIEPMPDAKDVVGAFQSRCRKLFGKDARVEVVLGQIPVVLGKKQRIVTSKVPHIWRQPRPE